MRVFPCPSINYSVAMDIPWVIGLAMTMRCDANKGWHRILLLGFLSQGGSGVGLYNAGRDFIGASFGCPILIHSTLAVVGYPAVYGQEDI